jgi:uncharacterized membrane protein YdjX (TVP38/TMEM64 family)
MGKAKNMSEKTFKRSIPILLIITIMLVGFILNWQRFLSFETIRYHHLELIEYVNNNPIMTPFMFIGSYAVSTALSIPGALLLSLLGGYLFPQPWSTFYVLIGATTGASLLFLAAKTALKEQLYKKARPRLKKMEKGFNENAANYLLFCA